MPSNKDNHDHHTVSSSSSSNSRNNKNQTSRFSVPPSRTSTSISSSVAKKNASSSVVAPTSSSPPTSSVPPTTKQTSSSSSSSSTVMLVIAVGIVLIVILLSILVLGSTPPQNNTLLLHSCFPDKQYEPPRFPWKRGQKFPPGKTPLTMLKNREIPPRVLPDSWDGGYGWVFVKYIPSAFETRWAKEAAPIERNRDVVALRRPHPGLPLCNLLFEKFRKQNSKYIAASGLFTSNNGAAEKCNMSTFPPQNPVRFDRTIFSRFEYEWKCTLPPCRSPNTDDAPRIGAKKYAYIEPLSGILRHPGVCQNPAKFLVNKNYMIVDAWSLMHPSRSTTTMPPPDLKVIFLDLGASTWDEGWGGASQTWFHGIYEGMCINFTDWFMFEAQNLDPKNVFKLLPGHIKPGYRWYNILLSTNLDSWDNPLNHLLLEARKEDIVIVKIDFDSPDVEAALLMQILEFPEIAELIDELYFEHHVNVDILKDSWATQHSSVYQSDSIKLFTALRKKGIRAHSWV